MTFDLSPGRESKRREDVAGNSMALHALRLSFGYLRLGGSPVVSFARCVQTSPVTYYSQGQINPPKRPGGSFFNFVKAKEADIKRENPTIRRPELVKLASSLWNTLEETEKDHYVSVSKKEQEEYQNKYQEFLDGLSPEQRDMLQQKAKQRQQKLQQRRTKTLLRKLEKPKRPISPFLRFCASVDRGEAPLTQFASGCGEVWRRMAEDDKEEFKQAYAKEMLDYEKQLVAWEERVGAEGHPEVVRGYAKKIKREKNAQIQAKKKEKMLVARTKRQEMAEMLKVQNQRMKERKREALQKKAAEKKTKERAARQKQKLKVVSTGAKSTAGEGKDT